MWKLTFAKRLDKHLLSDKGSDRHGLLLALVVTHLVPEVLALCAEHVAHLIEGLGFRIWGLGDRIRVQGLGSRV